MTLGIACSGLMIVGPMQLFFPVQASIRWPGWVWVPLLILYFLAVVLAMLWSKPRLIVYGMSVPQFRSAILESATKIDHQATWIGDVLDMPQSRIQLALEPAFSRGVHLVAWIGGYSNLADWVLLERNLVTVARQSEATPSRFGWLLLFMGMILLVSSLMPVVLNPELAFLELQQLLLR